jgi:hypothetical protein
MSPAAISCCSASLTQYKQQKQPTTQNKKVDMSKSKKKNTKVRDMNPKKDAKGGGGGGKPSPQGGGTSPLGGGGTSGPSGGTKPTYT